MTSESPPAQTSRSFSWRKVGLVVGLLLAFLVTAGIGVTSARRSAVETASDGTLCASCHESPAEMGAHGLIGCDSCHIVGDPVAFSLWRANHGLGEAPAHGAQVGTCQSCHADTPNSPLASEGHAAHANAGCQGCHGSTHDGRPPLECVGCHADVERHGATAEVSCTTCHLFAAPDPGAQLTAVSPRTAGLSASEVGWTALHGAMDCRRCHNPHQDTPFQANCVSCHRGRLSAAQETGPAGHRECSGCHEPHAPRDQIAVDCLGCHVYPERGHAWATRSTVSVAEREASERRITHGGQCGTCHEPHSWTASEARCVDCHEEQANLLTGLPEGTHTGCMSCHQPHEARPNASVCASCHPSVHAGSSGGPAAHRNCLSCHDAHGGRPEPRVACSSCHREAHSQSLSRARRHQRCESCHAVHGAPLAPTPNACARCHAPPELALRAARPEPPAAHRCASCHIPHTFLGDGAALARCAACHAEATTASASHRGACTTCHDPHGAPLAGASECATCHAGVEPTVAAHQRCTGCHEPHRAAARAVEECQECHIEVDLVSRSWPASTPHGGRCVDCHTPHAEERWRACEGCHVRQSTRAHTGGHPSCVQCHAPHEPLPAGTDGWWSRCAACHASEAEAVLASTGTHGQCSACHASPGPPLPACVSCHADTPARLSHRSHSEQDCATCHSTHGIEEIGRATCLQCHDDRAGHFADATQCQSCHPFAH